MDKYGFANTAQTIIRDRFTGHTFNIASQPDATRVLDSLNDYHHQSNDLNQQLESCERHSIGLEVDISHLREQIERLRNLHKDKRVRMTGKVQEVIEDILESDDIWDYEGPM